MTIDHQRRAVLSLMANGILLSRTTPTFGTTGARAASGSIPPRLLTLAVFSPIASEPEKGGVNRLARYEHWLGRKISKITDNASETGDWAQLKRTTIYARDFWDKKPVDLLLRIPLLPASATGQFKAGAEGSFDPHFLELARGLAPILAREISGTTYTLRIGLGWENNGNWYPWFAKIDPDAYKTFYRHVVGLFRSVDPRFRFDWNTSLGTMQIAPDVIFPGKDYVDTIGLDIYDQFPIGSSYGFGNHARRFTELYKGGAFGLDYWNDKSKTLRIPITVGEWGVADWTKMWIGGGVQGGGDNPYFIEQMAAWFDSLGDRLIWQSYFERFYKGVNHSLSRGPMLPDNQTPGPSVFPQSSAKYRELFGANAS